MAAMLHDVIIDIIKNSKKDLTVREITNIINDGKLWYRPKDNRLPDATQVSARVSNYKKIFSKENGFVKLANKNKIEQKIARLTFNSSGWKSPSGALGKSKAKSYEKSNGFGHEEWLLDFTKEIDGYHYGFLEPVNKFRNKYIGSTFEILLYTVNSQTKEKFWVGTIKNAEVIDRDTSADIKTIYENNGWYKKMKDELTKVGLNADKLDKWGGDALFNVRFRYEDYYPLPPATKIDPSDSPITSYHYILLNVAKKPSIFKENRGKFILGNNNPERRYSGKSVSKKIEEKSIQYAVIHDQINFELEKILLRKSYKVFPEHDTGYKTSVDIVAVNKKEMYFYEIKTYPDVKTCVRNALGQLIEYSYYPGRKLADKIFIVTPHVIGEDIQNYISYLRKETGLPLHYIAFDLENNKIAQEF